MKEKETRNNTERMGIRTIVLIKRANTLQERNIKESLYQLVFVVMCLLRPDLNIPRDLRDST